MPTNPLLSGYMNSYDSTVEARVQHDVDMELWRKDPNRSAKTLPYLSHEERQRTTKRYVPEQVSIADLAKALAPKEFINDPEKEAEYEAWMKEQMGMLKKIQSKPQEVSDQTTLALATPNQLRAATLNGQVIIDQVCTLTFPINDPRTPADIRALYLAQEELMMQPDDAEEPDLSSPAHDSLDINWTEIAVRGLKYMTPEDRSKCRAAERAFIEKAYGVKFDE